MTTWDSENTTAAHTLRDLEPDPITVAARLMLDNHNAFWSVQPYDKQMNDRVVLAAVYGVEAYESAPCNDIGTAAMVRSFLTALIDPLHYDLDYLRADPASGAAAREAAGRVLDGRTWDQMPGVADG